MSSAIVHGLDLADRRTHIERLDDITPYSHERNPSMLTSEFRARQRDLSEARGEPQPLAPTEWAHDDHPMGERRPYRATLKGYTANSMPIRPGDVQELLPHEVGKHHVFAQDIADARAKAAADAKAVAEAKAAKEAADKAAADKAAAEAAAKANAQKT